MARFIRDDNRVPVVGGISSSDPNEVVPVAVDPATNRMLVQSTGGSGASVQYVDGSSEPVPTGNVIMWRNNNDILAVADNTPLPVEDAPLQVSANSIDASAIQLVNQTTDVATNTTLSVLDGKFTKTNNNAAPNGDNLGVLPALVNASSPTFTEGNLSLLSVNTTGNLRTSTNQIGGTAVAVNNGTASAGTQRVTIASDSTGNIATIGTSITPGTGATNLGKAEDAAHTSGDVGVMDLGVVNAGAATTFSSTNGDYVPTGKDGQGRIYMVQKSPTATLSNVASSATSVTILASNTARLGASVYNDSTQNLYLKFGTTASTTSFTVLLATNAYYEVPGGYTGIIDGIWSSANGSARVTELS